MRSPPTGRLPEEGDEEAEEEEEETPSSEEEAEDHRTRRGRGRRIEEEREEDLAALWTARMAMAKELEAEIRSLRLSRESNALGKVLSEIKSLQKSERKLTRSALDDGNIRHLRDVVDVAREQYTNVTGILRSFVLVSPQQSELYKHVVDIVADGGATWVKVISRTARGVAMDWLTGSSRTVVQQARVYLEHAALFPHSFASPRVVFHFIAAVPDRVAEKLTALRVHVEGERVPLESLCYAPPELLEKLMAEEEEDEEEEEEEEAGEEEDTSQPGADEDNGVAVESEGNIGGGASLPPSVPSRPPVNLDVSSVFVLISNLTHPGGIAHRFDSALLREQAAMEKNIKARDSLLAAIGGRPWMLCATAVNAVREIVATVGGPLEKQRWEALEPHCSIVPDAPSERSCQIEMSAKVNDRAIKIFGTGDALRVVTASANKHFVQSAFHQGVHFAVIIHESRALSEQKELPL